jgi:hypothetical protein
LALIDRIGPKHGENVVAHELLAHVFDEDVLRLYAEQERLVLRGTQLLALAEIGGKGDHLGAVFGLQPLQDDRGVETARIGEHDLLDGRLVGHDVFLNSGGVRARCNWPTVGRSVRATPLGVQGAMRG